MTTYTPEIKAAHIARAKAHLAADKLLWGQYWDDGVGRGCSVGCHAKDLGLDLGDHTGLARALGWPTWLVHLQDCIFEGLDKEDAGQWHVDLAEAVPVDTDLTPVYHRIMARVLREVAWSDQPDDEWGCAAAVRAVAALHDRGAGVTADEWMSAVRAALAAAEAAKAEAREAKAAARAAAWSAKAEALAARESAAWSAAALEAAAAARRTAYRQIRDIVLEELV